MHCNKMRNGSLHRSVQEAGSADLNLDLHHGSYAFDPSRDSSLMQKHIDASIFCSVLF